MNAARPWRLPGRPRPGHGRRHSHRHAIHAAFAAGLVAAAGCGISAAPAHHGGTGSAAGITSPVLGTTLSAANGTSWAVMPMGNPAIRGNEFWELFVRQAGHRAWRLATPPGAASNGGLVTALSGAGMLIAGFRPSQDLRFSPLAATTNAGRSWAQSNVLGSGVADLPMAMAADPTGRLVALTAGGNVEVGTGRGASWRRLTSLRALSRTPAIRVACNLTALTAVAFAPAGPPMLGGSCAPGESGGTARAARTGILTLSAGSWRLSAPLLPPTASPRTVTVLGLRTDGVGTTAILAFRTGAVTAIAAAWLPTRGSSWTLSPALRTGAGSKPAISIWASGSAGLVWGHRAATISWGAASWHVLPPLPGQTVSLAQTAAGQPEALASSDGTLAVWRLPAGAAHADWIRAQTVHVTIPYGSSS